MPDEVELIKQRADILEIVGEHVQLTRSGASFKGLCPFHKEKTPSFFVYPDTGTYFCFGCQARGDVFNWVMQTEGLDFKEALERLANRYNVTLSTKTFVKKDETSKLKAVLDESLRFFVAQLSANLDAKEYALKRGFDEETLSKWEIGFAPDGGESLASHLKKKGFMLIEGAHAGVLSGNERTGYQDLFRNRLMFPIRDEKKNLVGFGGRGMQGVEPKYVNSPNTLVFQKNELLYGMQFAKDVIRKTRHATLVEGYIDVIACHRAGITDAVAPLGTSFGEKQAGYLAKFCDSVTVFYDGDDAGIKASERAMLLLLANNINCKASLLKPGEDPDSLFTKHGAPAVVDAVKNAISLLRFKIEVVKRKHNATQGIDSEQFWNEVKQTLSRAQNKLEQQEVVAEIATYHPASKHNLYSVVESLKKDVALIEKRIGSTGKRALVNMPLIKNTLDIHPFERIIIRAFLRPELRSYAIQCLREDDCSTSLIMQGFQQKFIEIMETHGEGVPPSVIIDALSDEQKNIIKQLERPIEGPIDEQVLLSELDKRNKERELQKARESAIMQSEGENEEDALANYVKQLASNRSNKPL